MGADNNIQYPGGPFWEEVRILWKEAFERSTEAALRASGHLGEPHATALACLSDIEWSDAPDPGQQYGATWKQLAYISHLASMSREERKAWYEIAQQIPLSGRHAAHIIARLQEMGNTEVEQLEKAWRASE